MRVDAVNTGRRVGAEVPQVYVGFPAGTGEPPKQLKGFGRVVLAPGDRQTVSIELDERAFAYWDVAAHGWRVDTGCYRVLAGSSSRDLPNEAVVAVGGASCVGAVARLRG